MASVHCLTLQKTLPGTLVTQGEHSLLHAMCHRMVGYRVVGYLPTGENPNVEPFCNNVVRSRFQTRGINRGVYIVAGDAYENSGYVKSEVNIHIQEK